jgi:hypothetical protein
LLKDYNKLLKKAKKWIYSLGAVPECTKDVSKGRTKHNKIFVPAGSLDYYIIWTTIYDSDGIDGYPLTESNS